MFDRTFRSAAILALGLSFLGGCENTTAPKHTAAIQQQAQKAGQVVLSFPAGYSPWTVGIYATDSMRIAPGVVVADATGTPAAAVNVGTGALVVGGKAQTGSLVSGGAVSIDGGTVVTGNVQAAGGITTQAGVQISGAQSPNTALGQLLSIRFTPKFPVASSGLLLQNSASGTLAPGAYTSVVVNPGSTLSLMAGIYYVDALQVESQAKLALDTHDGSVIIHVRQSLNFKGQIVINGPGQSFLLDYLGTNSISIESPFNGTIIAPSAALRLAPVGSSPGHHGSFFAKSIDTAEANSRITYEPFDYWYDLLDIHPLVDCVRRGKFPRGAALFGYENESDFPVKVPAGRANFVTANVVPPASPGIPPTTLEGGSHPRDFWAPFDLSGPASWTLAGETAVATGSGTLCQLGQVPPDDKVQSTGVEVSAEEPDTLGPTAQSELVPDVVSPYSVTLPAPVFDTGYKQKAPPAAVSSSGTIGSIQQGLTSEYSEIPPPPDGPFTFEVTKLGYNRSDGCLLDLCGTSDPHVHNLIINGQHVGDTSSGTVLVSRSQATVSVYLEVWDDYSSGIGNILIGGIGSILNGSDFLDAYALVIDNLKGAENCVSGSKGSICYRAVGTRSPRTCFTWPAQFVDSGPWSGFPGTEDFGVSRSVQPLPASFARANIKIVHGGRNIDADPDYNFIGPLDANGCIPDDRLPFREEWKAGQATLAVIKLQSQFCYDPDRAANEAKCCADYDPAANKCNNGGPPYQGVNMVAHHNINADDKGTGPEEYCWRFTEDGSQQSGCDSQGLGWSDLPTNDIVFQPQGPSGLTGLSAGMAQYLKREDETRTASSSVGLGVVEAFSRDPAVRVLRSDVSCPGDPPLSSCAPYISTASTHEKYVIAHELTHYIFVHGPGSAQYGMNAAGEPDQGPMCRCDHVTNGDNQTHCLQSLEPPDAAQLEGFAQFMASKVWNKEVEEGQTDCTFVYYKGVLNTQCMPGVSGADCTRYDAEHFLSMPPVPIDCNAAVRWRNTYCVDSSSSPDDLAYGTEYDWMEFYHAINNDPDPARRWSVVDILDLYAKARYLNGGQGPVSWSGGSIEVWINGVRKSETHASLLAAVQALIDEGRITAAAGTAFIDAGNQYGVSNVWQ